MLLISFALITSISHCLHCPCLRNALKWIIAILSGWSFNGSYFSSSVCSNTAARRIARLPRTPHISAFMFDHLHWLPLIALTQLKILTLIYRSQIDQSPKYFRDLIRMPSSAISLRPLRSLDRHDLCPAREDFHDSDTSLCNHWPLALEPTPSFYAIHVINWWDKCFFLLFQDCALLSGSLALQIGLHSEKRYINL